MDPVSLCMHVEMDPISLCMHVEMYSFIKNAINTLRISIKTH
jgi:hypothetical protein